MLSRIGPTKGWFAVLSRSPIKWVVYFLVGALILGLPFVRFQQGAFWVRVVGYTMLYIILGLGLNIQVGFAGLLDLGFVAFYAIGAYTYSLLASGQFGIHLSFWLVLPLAALLAGITGVLLGIPVLRMRGDYLAIVTLAFGEIVRILATNLKGLTNGSQGVVGIDPPVLFGAQLRTGTHFYFLIFFFLILVLLLVSRLNFSRIGRAWNALREDEDVAQMMGINTTSTKLLSFGIGAMIGGLAGAIFSAWQGSIFPDNFNLMVSINVICLVIIGGLGNIPGVMLGAVALITLPDLLREFSDFRLLLFGLLLVIMMIARPNGFIPARRPSLEARSRSPEAGTTVSPPVSNEPGENK